jgi:CHAT domain-containing protein/tetratricopeptide (TPR) repeat protein
MKSIRARFRSVGSLAFIACSAFISAYSQGNNAPPMLEPEKRIAREMARGEAHKYQLTLAAGEFALVVVEERGIDVAVNLLNAKDEKIEERILPGHYGRVNFSILAQTGVTYGVEIKASSTQSNAGQYEIRLAERRNSGDRDQTRADAERAATEGWRLSAKGDADSTNRAREKFETARTLWQKLDDRYGQGVALFGQGQSWQPQSQYQNALKCYEQAIAHFQAAGAQREAAAMRNLAGRALVAVGAMERGIQYFLESQQFWNATNDRDGAADAFYSLGFAYGRLHDYQKAIAYYEKALPLHHALGNRRQEGQTLNNIGAIFGQQNDYQQAITYLQRAKEIWQEQKNTLQVITALTNIGAAYNGLNEYQKAVDYYQQALAGWRSVKNQTGEATALNNLSQTFNNLGKKSEAREYAAQALAISLEIGDRRVQTESRATIATISRYQGDYKEARQQIERLLAGVEADRATIRGQSSRTSWFAEFREFYDLYLDILMRQREAGYEAAAFGVSENFRARSLLELLKESGAVLRRNVDPALVARELRLREKIEAASDAQRKLSGAQATTERKEQLQRELTLLTAEYEQVQSEIRLRHPQYAALTWPHPLTLPEIQRQSLDKETLLLEYALGDENSYLFAVTPNSISAFTLPKREVIERAAKRYYQQVTALGSPRIFNTAKEKQAWLNQINQECQSAAAALSQTLIEPAKHLLGTKRLMIVGDGILHYVPFAALPSPSRPIAPSPRRPAAFTPLIVDHEIVTLPSASTLAVLRSEMGQRKPAPKTIAVFADPVFEREDERLKADLAQATPPKNSATAPLNEPNPLRGAIEEFVEESGDPKNGRLPRLPSTRAEALAILALAPESERMVKLDFDANYDVVTSAELQSYRYIHFATHGLLNNANPELSGLALSLLDQDGRERNGFLRTMDVSNLRLAADLVVLSGCRTGLGKEVTGEGMLGLTRAFLYAGTRRVVSSLWQVNDVATAELMKRFYQGMLGDERLSPSTALRVAQIAMWKSKRWSFPYYWAAFALQGEW